MSGVVGPRINDVDPAVEKAAMDQDGEDEMAWLHLEATGVDPFDEPDPSWDDPAEFVEDDDDGE